MTRPGLIVSRVAAVIAAAAVTVACGLSSKTTLSSAASSPCPAPRLHPAYLPAGSKAVRRAAVADAPAWSSSWVSGGTFVQVLGGISADRGDESSAKKVDVRGHTGLIGPVEIQDASLVELVDWTEPSPCGPVEFAVATKGSSQAETLRIARSLREGA